MTYVIHVYNVSPMTKATTKKRGKKMTTAADLANEALDAMMSVADRAYWAAVAADEKSKA